VSYPVRQDIGPSPLAMRRSGESLADILERVLDKGVVIAGDIAVNVLDIELLTLKVRLLIASADTAKEMGIDWWTADPFLSRNAAELQRENDELRERLERLERMLGAGNGDGPAS
jgi:Gas vesicle protein